MQIDAFEAAQPAESGHGQTLDQIAVQTQPFEQLQTLEGPGFYVAQLRVGHLQPSIIKSVQTMHHSVIMSFNSIRVNE